MEKKTLKTECQKLSGKEKELIKKQVKCQFDKLVSTLNKKDPIKWSEFYSKDEFISAICSTDYFGKRETWIKLITKFFSIRKKQSGKPMKIRINALAQNLALLTSEQNIEINWADGKKLKAKHVFTMIWQKEKDAWKIIHSHESWCEK